MGVLRPARSRALSRCAGQRRSPPPASPPGLPAACAEALAAGAGSGEVGGSEGGGLLSAEPRYRPAPPRPSPPLRRAPEPRTAEGSAAAVALPPPFRRAGVGGRSVCGPPTFSPSFRPFCLLQSQKRQPSPPRPPPSPAWGPAPGSCPAPTAGMGEGDPSGHRDVGASSPGG